MKRVLFLNPGHPARGGIENGLVTLCRALPSSAWSVSIGVTKGPRFHNPQAFRDGYPDIDTVTVESVTGTREGRIRAIQKCVRRLAPDIVVAPRIPDAYPAIAILKQQGYRIHLAANIRGSVPEQIADMQLFAGYIDMAVGANRLLQQTIEACTSIPGDRIFAISSGVPLPTSDVFRKPSSDSLHLGYIGRLDHHDKRVLDLVGLIEQLMNLQVPVIVHIVGDGSDYYSSSEELQTLLRPLELKTQVIWHGWLSKAKLQESILPRLDCCLLFSQSEGAPTALREAMAYGVVPVSSEFLGCHAEQLYHHNENCLLFPVGDVTIAARHIERLHKDRELLTKMSAAAAISVKANETFEASTEKWLVALDYVLEQPIRIGAGVPLSTLRSPGRLSRLPPSLAEGVRRAFGRQNRGGGPGDEWPSTLGVATPESVDRINRSLINMEAMARKHWHQSQ